MKTALVNLALAENHAIPTASDSLEGSYAHQAGAFADGDANTTWVTGRVMRGHWAKIEWRKVSVTIHQVEIDFSPVSVDYEYVESYLTQKMKRVQVRTTVPRVFDLEVEMSVGGASVRRNVVGARQWKTSSLYVVHLDQPLCEVTSLTLSLMSQSDQCFAIRELRILGPKPPTSVFMRPKWRGTWIWHEPHPVSPGIGIIRRFFRREFIVRDPKAIRRATLLFCAYDRGSVSLNGTEVARTRAPGIGLTRTQARVAIDPKRFRKGKNALSLVGEIVENHRFSYGVLAELWIEYRNGSRECIATTPGAFEGATDECGDWKPSQAVLQPSTSYGAGPQALTVMNPNAEPRWMYSEEYTPPWFAGAVRVTKFDWKRERSQLAIEVEVGKPLDAAFGVIFQFGEHGATEIRTMDFNVGEAWIPPSRGLPRGFRGKKTLVLPCPADMAAARTILVRFCNARSQLEIVPGPVGQVTGDPHPGRLRLSLELPTKAIARHSRPRLADFPRCKVVAGGRISVNGRLIAPVLFNSSLNRPDTMLASLRSGVRIIRVVPHNTCALVPPEEPIEVHHEKILSTIAAHADVALPEFPDAKFVLMLRLDLPNLWKLAHPESWILMGTNQAVMGLGGSRNPAFGYVQETPNAPAVLRAITGAVRAFIRRLANQPYAHSVIGITFYHGVAGENYWGMNYNLREDEQGRVRIVERKDLLLGDCGHSARRDLRDWLKAKYKTREALAKAWKVPGIDFDDITRPEKWPNHVIHSRLAWRTRPKDRFMFRDEIEEGSFYRDFVQHHNEARVQLFEEACRAAKEASGGRLLVGGYSGCYSLPALTNSVPGGIQHCAQAAWQKLMECPHMDWYMSPPVYHLRVPGDPVMPMGLDDSVRLHGKIWMHEFDSRTFLGSIPPKAFSQWDAQQQLRKEFAYAITKDQGWWWLEFLFGSSGTMAASWFNDECIRADVAVMKRVYDRYLQNSNAETAAEIAVFVNVEQAYHTDVGDPANTLHANIVNQFLPKFHQLGAPFDLFALADLPRLVKRRLLRQYKFVVFANAFHLTRALRNCIARHVKRDGRTVLFLYAPGYQGNAGQSSERSVRGIEEVTGLRGVVRRAERRLPGLEFAGRARPRRFDAITWWGPEFEAQAALFGHGIGPIFHLDPARSNGWRPLAWLRLDRRKHADKVALAVGRERTHTVLYSVVPDLPLAWLAQAAASSGVHFYSEPGVVTYANRHFLCVQSRRARNNLRLTTSRLVRWLDPFEKKVHAEAARIITVDLKPGETKLFCLDSNGEWSGFGT